MKTRTVHVGNVLIGSDHPIVVQTMCNTHTSDVEATVAQCLRLIQAGSQLIRITVPSLKVRVQNHTPHEILPVRLRLIHKTCRQERH